MGTGFRIMKFTLAVAALAGMLIFAAQAQGGLDVTAGRSAGTGEPPMMSWSEWRLSLDSAAAPAQAATAAEPILAAAAEVDVVDAHWMALTMWGEARGQGEEAMRAVGHVIANRWNSGGRHGPFVTDTVSEAWQFSCWNAGDPNLAAIRNVDALPEDSRDYRMWRAARRIADEILAGQSQDPTGGALFYHTVDVAPRWSRGVEPVRRIGPHLFFLTAA